MAAATFVNKFRAHRKVSKILVEMEQLSSAYIQFAYVTLAKKSNSGGEGRYNVFLNFLFICLKCLSCDVSSTMILILLFSFADTSQVFNFENRQFRKHKLSYNYVTS